MKKIPFGIIAGACAMIIFYATLGFVAAYIIFGGEAAQTGTAFSPFEYWWQTLIFIVDIIAFIGFCVSMTFFFIKKKKIKEEANKIEEVKTNE